MSQSLRLRLKLYPLLLLPALIFFAPVLFFGRAFADGDAVTQLYPALKFFHQSLQSGDSFGWNPHVMSGFPTAASLMGGFFSPLHQLVYRLVDPIPAYAFLTAVNYALFAIFSLELVLALGLPAAAALFVGLILPWISAHATWAANFTMTGAFFLVPAWWWLVLVLARSRSWLVRVAAVLVGGLLGGRVLLTAHWQLLVQTVIATVAWALVLEWQQWRTAVRRQRGLVIGGALVMIALAVGLGFRQVELFRWAQGFAVRFEGVSFREAQGGAIGPLDLLSTVFPELTVPGVTGIKGFLYLGVLPWVFLVYAWAPRPRGRVWFFTLVLGFCLLLSLRFPPLAWLYNQLPFFNQFRALSRWMHVGFLALLVVSAHGFTRMLQQPLSARAEKIFLRLFQASVGLTIAVAVWTAAAVRLEPWFVRQATAYFDRHRFAQTSRLPKEHYHRLLANIITEVRTETSLTSWPVAVSLGSLMVGLYAVSRRNRLGPARFAAASVAVGFANVFLVALPTLPTVSAAQFADVPPPVQWFQQQPTQDFRVFTFLSGFTVFDRLDAVYGFQPEANVALHRNVLQPNLGPWYGIAAFDYYDNLMDRRHARLLSYLGSSRAVGNFENLSAHKISLAEKQRLFLDRLPVLGAYNVRYLISAYPFDHPALTEVLRWEATDYRIPLYLYEVANVRPRYFVTSRAEFSPPLSEAESWKKNLTAIGQGKTLVECDRCPEVREGQAAWTLVEEKNAAYRFRVTTDAPRLFVFGQNFLPGWQATVDGTPTEIFRARYVNQAVLVPAGDHVVTFTFSR